MERFEASVSPCSSSMNLLCQAFVRAEWPALKELDLTYASFDPDHIALLAGGNWPLLEKVSIGGPLDDFRSHGLRQLANAAWPLLTSFHAEYHEIESVLDIQPLFEKWPSLKVVTDYGVKSWSNVR